MNQPFTAALSIINALGVNPDAVHPLQWGRMWANLTVIRCQPHEDADWEQLLKHMAWPEENEWPSAFRRNEHVDKLEKVIEEIYQL